MAAFDVRSVLFCGSLAIGCQPLEHHHPEFLGRWPRRLHRDYQRRRRDFDRRWAATPYEDAGKTIIVPWMRAHGIESVDAILLSHPDGDHVGGTPSILSQYPGARLLISDQFAADPAMLDHLRQWGVSTDSVVWLPKISSLTFGALSASVECPDRLPGSGTNDGSMFVRVSEGNGSAMFTGDAPKEVERACEADANWGSEILHVGHHGSRTATDPSWVKAVHPKYAIVSVGRSNRYGLPNQEVLDLLARSHTTVLRTDRDGTITFTFNGTEFARTE